MTKKVVIALILLILPIGLLITKIDGSTDTHQTVLKNSWENYKKTYIDESGAVKRPDQGNDVVSEGVAYAMLRAVWMNDQQTFDRVYAWTEKNLSRQNNPSFKDNLLAWKYTDHVADWGAASDADEDYALALVFADKQWGIPSNGSEPYLNKAKKVMTDILNLETGKAGDKIYLQPGTWNAFQAPIPVNPSYLSPAHYRIFNQVQPDERWNQLITSSYEILWKSSQTIEGSVGVGLPADWVEVHADGSIKKLPNFTIDYKYDAFRTSMRVAFDYQWFNSPDAANYLAKSGARNLLLKQFNETGKIATEYTHDGRVIGQYDNPGTYGANIGWFLPENPEIVEKFITKMNEEYTKNTNFFPTPNYYMENIAWIGYGIGTNSLPNIYAEKLAQTPAPSSTQPKVSSINQTEETTESFNLNNKLFIVYPFDTQTISGKFTFQVINNKSGATETWWSVDDGSWVPMYKPAQHVNFWIDDIDITNWNWSDNSEYILHAWTKDKDGNIYHTQTQIKK